MGRFYIRVYKDDERERTWGCGSRSQNQKNLETYFSDLFNYMEKRKTDPLIRALMGKKYRFELIRNRNGEKYLYREIEIELDYELKSITICMDNTHLIPFSNFSRDQLIRLLEIACDKGFDVFDALKELD